MNDESANRIQRGGPENQQTLSGREILIVLTIIALVCVGGYFFLMKMIEVSQQEDCVLAHRRNCAAEPPSTR
jgi:hypothetical protein